MSTPVRCRWPVPLAVVALLAGPALAQPAEPGVIDRLLALKQVPTDEKDSPLRKLQKERYNARLLATQATAKAYRAGAISFGDLGHLVTKLADNGAELEDGPESRVKWHQLRVDLLKEQERLLKEQIKAGRDVSPAELGLVVAARADAEIDLLKLRESIQKK